MRSIFSSSIPLYFLAVATVAPVNAERPPFGVPRLLRPATVPPDRHVQPTRVPFQATTRKNPHKKRDLTMLHECTILRDDDIDQDKSMANHLLVKAHQLRI